MDSENRDIKELYETEGDYDDSKDDSNLADLSMEELLARIPLKRVRKKKKKRIPSFKNKGTVRDEWYFQHRIVIPQLEEEGHNIRMVAPSRSGLFLHPVIDIFSILNGKNYFTEVKVKANIGYLQKAVGQLVIHRLIQEWDGKVHPENVYQIVFPSFCKDEKIFSPRLYQLLLEREQIKILFF